MPIAAVSTTFSLRSWKLSCSLPLVCDDVSGDAAVAPAGIGRLSGSADCDDSALLATTPNQLTVIETLTCKRYTCHE